MVGQPTPATCRAQRYSCLLPGGQGRGRREVGAWPAAVVTQGLTVTSSANMPAQGPPPTLALAHRLCPGAYWASSAGSGAGQLQGSPQPRIPHNTRGLPTTPGSRRASAAPRGPTVCRPGAHPTSQTAVLQGSQSGAGKHRVRWFPDHPEPPVWVGWRMQAEGLRSPGGGRGEGTPDTKLKGSSPPACPAVLRAGTSGIEGGDAGGDGGEAPETGPGPRTSDGAGRS